MRDRAGVILIENGHVALIRRRREEREYYVLPGGGIEKGETPKTAAKREALEELGVEVEIGRCLAKLDYAGEQFYFHAKITGGAFGTGCGEEYSTNRNRGTYQPVWEPVSTLESLNLKPESLIHVIKEVNS